MVQEMVAAHLLKHQMVAELDMGMQVAATTAVVLEHHIPAVVGVALVEQVALLQVLRAVQVALELLLR